MRRIWLAVLALGAGMPALAQGYVAPRSADGHAEIGGVWSNGVEAPLERPEGVSALVVTAEQAAASEKLETMRVRDELRTSVVVEPGDGRIPFRDRDRTLAWRSKYGVYLGGFLDPDFIGGADSLPVRDRCLIAVDASGPPMLSGGYNSAYHIVQTPGFVMIDPEMMHDARVIPVFADAEAAARGHRPQVMRRWMGDSTGWWEGDTFVIETVDIHALQRAQGPVPMSKDGKVIERFTRVGEKELLYRFEVSDPATYAQTWVGEASWHPDKRVFEYACHEGNYGLVGILRGARKVERDAAAAKRR